MWSLYSSPSSDDDSDLDINNNVSDRDFTELSFVPDGFLNKYKDNWFSTTKSISLKNQLNISKLDLISNRSANVRNLKYLKIDSLPPSFNLENLNLFTNLEILHLEIKMDYSRCLRLPELKALSIATCLTEQSFWYSGRELGYLNIYAPKLHGLEMDAGIQIKLEDKRIKFHYPDSIEYLRATDLDESLLVFEHLKHLEIFEEGSLVTIDKDLLSKLRRLKKLSIASLSMNNVEVYDLESLFEFLNGDLELVLEGVKMNDRIINVYEETEDKLEFQLNNYGNLVDDLNFVTEIQYHKMMRLLRDNQPSNLFKKYTNIQKLIVDSRTEKENQLLRFIAKCNNLYHLEIIYESSLSQSFFGQLPAISSLTRLMIVKIDVELNFKFIMKMPYLVEFFTDQDVKLNKLNLNNLKYLKRFKFTLTSSFDRNLDFVIIKKDSDKYEIENARELNLYYLSDLTFTELVEKADYLRCM